MDKSPTTTPSPHRPRPSQDGKTTVVNRHTDPYDFLIDRTTIFGNRYYIGTHGTREEVIAKYKVYFNERIVTDKNFRDRVKALKGFQLGCCCAPLPCHGDVIAEWLESEES